MSEASENSLDVATPEEVAEVTEAMEATEATEVGADETAVECSSVGSCLRAAREEANLSVVEIAQALKFSTRQIELLEADDYAALPGNTIVRGFVRSYGRLLKLDVDALLHMLDARTPNAPADVRPPDNMGVASQPGAMQQLSPMVSAAIVLSLVTLLLGLWHFFGPTTVATKPSAVTTNQSLASAQTPQSPVPASGDMGALPASAAAPAEASANATSAPASTAAAAAPAGNAAPALLFVFQDRSWLEVSDATKQKLHSGENPAGSRLTLAGRPPFEVVVGNATKVTLTYGERAIDLAPYTRADVARLTLE